MPAETYPVRWAGRLAVVSMPAEIDLTNAPQILQRLASVLDREPVTVIVDMTSTAFCDSAGVSTLLRANKLAAGREAELRLAAPGRAVRRVFAITGLDQIISVYPSLQAALAAGQPISSSGTAGGAETQAGPPASTETAGPATEPGPAGAG